MSKIKRCPRCGELTWVSFMNECLNCETTKEDLEHWDNKQGNGYEKEN